MSDRELEIISMHMAEKARRMEAEEILAFYANPKNWKRTLSGKANAISGRDAEPLKGFRIDIGGKRARRYFEKVIGEALNQYRKTKQ